MDKSSGGLFRRGEEPSDLAFWLARPPEERLAALELIRRRIYGPDYDAGGIARVGRILRLSDLKREQASDPGASPGEP